VHVPPAGELPSTAKVLDAQGMSETPAQSCSIPCAVQIQREIITRWN